MSVFTRFSLAAAALLALAGCSTPRNPDLPSGPEAYAVMPGADPVAVPKDYQIGADDVLNIQVFQEPDLSNATSRVDGSGRIQVPLIGEVEAAGRTAPQLAQEIAARLGQRYVVNPQVVVGIAEVAPKFFTVEGQVKTPGVYQIGNDYTLLSAIARAQSTTNIAKLDEVIIFRVVNGQRMGAVFDLGAIRKGYADDPKLLAGDKVVVGFSSVKGAYRDFLQTAPVISLFTRF